MLIDEAEKRVAKILGLKVNKELPNVAVETLMIYHNYLSQNLSFPFEARYSYEAGFLKTIYYDIEVTDVLNMDECGGVEFYGLFCRGKRDRRKIIVPLVELEVKYRGKNKQLIDDYRMWFWNYR